MQLNLQKLFCENTSIPLNAEFDFSDLEFSGVYPILTPVKITGEILSKTGIVTLNGNIAYTYEADCDRCGTPAKKQYNIKVSKTIVTSLANKEEEDDIIVLPSMVLDLKEVVRAEVVLSVPTKHLCREDCKGICQICSKNLNEGECGCVKTETDPRLEVLKQLLTDE